jgi:hypothetical protein
MIKFYLLNYIYEKIISKYSIVCTIDNIIENNTNYYIIQINDSLIPKNDCIRWIHIDTII